jgi:hypothetical protein
VIPILPLIIAWDGVASNARTYTVSDLHELVADLQSDQYRWEIATIKAGLAPGRMIYLLGLPKAAN